MTTKEVKLRIIQSFIDDLVLDDDTKAYIEERAISYVDEDWVDEIAQAGYIKTE
jgi:hypothetical protein